MLFIMLFLICDLVFIIISFLCVLVCCLLIVYFRYVPLCSRSFLVYLFIRIAGVSYGRFMAYVVS